MKFHRFVMSSLATMIGLGIASQADAVIVSVKTLGMAATGVAYPLDALAAAYNPAGAVDVCDRLDLGITWARDWGHSKVHGNELDSIPLIHAVLGGDVNGKFEGFKTHDSYTPDFGINKRLGCDNEWAVGLVLYNRNYTKTTFNKPFVLFGTSNPGLEYVHETISPYVAYNWCDFNFGLSVNYMVQRLKVNGLEKLDRTPTLSNPVGSAHPGHVTNKGYDYSQGVGVSLGVQWHVWDCVTIGAVYQPQTSMGRFKKYKGFLAHSGKLDIPAMYSAGISWRIIDCLAVAFDWQMYHWENIKALSNNLLHDGIIEPLGTKNGPGFGFKNQNFFRVGLDWQITECWSARIGYRHGNTPIKRSQTAVNQLTLDCVEDFVTVGTSYLWNCAHEFSAFFAYGFEKTIKGKNSIPPGIPNALLAPLFGQSFGFGGGNADLTEGKLALGISWGWYY